MSKKNKAASEAAENTPKVEEAVETVRAEAAAEQTVQEAPAVKRSAHNTAAAAAFNAAGEETDVRRMKGEKRERKIKTNKIPYERKKRMYGYGFISLWLVGSLWLFVSPVITSLAYSLNRTIQMSKADAIAAGYTNAGIHLEWNNFGHYIKAFTGDPDFPRLLVESIGEIIPQAFVIMIFSLFIAIMLNQKFRGRTLARAIFFLPVLIATGPIITVINGDMASQGISGATQFSALFKTDLVSELLEFVGIYNINPQFTDLIEDITSNILNLVWNSGIQILIFLSALQNIPPSAKEAANMEGATAWEFFWKITFPIISPMILANLVYTIIDAFVSTDNDVMNLVLKQAQLGEYGYSAAMAWIYFAIIGAILGIVILIVNRFVYYENE
ncbi:MAG: sugar ABC transporter permease [Lachnospiraceae bacterium]|nr:sugar ABC transporter permease [Ruminococcus sp.]MCM1274441.1 sugar ABC transporter permease [Lachnospiraceae bacterium]